MQAEFRDRDEYQVEDLRLDAFVFRPDARPGEGVDLYGNADVGRIVLAYHAGKLLRDIVVCEERALKPRFERGKIGDGAVGLRDEAFLHEIAAQGLVHLPDGCGAYPYAALDAPSLRFRHIAPVHERFADERRGGDHGDGVVEILHLHRSEGDVDHGAVGIVLGHGYPVAHANHVVLRHLYASNQAHDGVLEYQHQNGGKRTETA